MRENCPCCRYPTLQARCFNEICLLCDWEDGAYNELYPEKVDGGPNGDYSLQEARQNFHAHLSMYRKAPKSLTVIISQKKKNLMMAYESLSKLSKEQESDKWEEITEKERDLMVYR